MAAAGAISFAAAAEPLGELFWEPGMEPARFAQTRLSNEVLGPGTARLVIETEK